MPARNNGGSTVLELTASSRIASHFTLFEIQGTLLDLAETAQQDGLTPEIQEAFQLYLDSAAEKRDRVAQFIHHCEGMAQLAKDEVKRIQTRQKSFESKAERVKSMVLRVLDLSGVPKLEGHTHALKKRKCPDAVELTDDKEIPAEFKRIELKLPLQKWDKLLASVSDEMRADVRAAILRQDVDVDLGAVKEALELERPVPGADLRINRFSLQIV